MNNKELRIDNYVQDDKGRLCRIVEVLKEPTFEGDYSYKASPLVGGLHTLPLKPIPLTEEWLFKFGFSITENQADILVNNRYNLRVTDLGYISIQKWTKMINLMVCCEYVHQLQNLYFELTREELTTE